MPYRNLKIILFGNIYQTKKNQYVEAVLRKLQCLGVKICVEASFARFIEENLHLPLERCICIDSGEDCDADAAISIGGDGTFLGTAAQIGASGVPILGINTGRLGFLADVSPENIDTALEALCCGEYVIHTRSVLEMSCDSATLEHPPFALNEVAVLKHDNSSLIEITTYVDDEFLTDYLADGLIVCTPTGSTGYSLSAGGPILDPCSGTLCISAVAPHSLSARPVVVCDNVEIRLEVRSRSHNFLLTADGRSQSLPEGSVVRIRKAPYTVKVIKITHRHFFDTLREKMMWGADRRR